MKNSNSRVMHLAHILQRRRHDLTWSDILKHAWYFEHFRNWLHDGLVEFTYLKKDNSIRDARGTLSEYLIPKEAMPKSTGEQRQPNYAIINYFDIDKRDWRSFDIRLFVGYVTIYSLKREK